MIDPSLISSDWKSSDKRIYVFLSNILKPFQWLIGSSRIKNLQSIATIGWDLYQFYFLSLLNFNFELIALIKLNKPWDEWKEQNVERIVKVEEDEHFT